MRKILGMIEDTDARHVLPSVHVPRSLYTARAA
jgi:hypothetical protein